VGTVSTVVGTIVGALLQAWREQVSHRRQLAARWDETLLVGLTDYLASADRLVCTLLRWRQVPDADTSQREALVAAVTDALDDLHEKSQLVTLLSGDRDHAVREASRRMRETLRVACDMAQGRRAFDDQQVRNLDGVYRAARDTFIRAAQTELRLNG
jgi:hypothetical protein